MRHYLIAESHPFLILKVNHTNTFVSLCTYAELILRESGASCSVTVPSAALAGLGARQMKLISGTLTTLIILTSSQSGPPYLHASCSGLLCCPFIMQNPQFRDLSRASLSKATPHTLEKKA